MTSKLEREFFITLGILPKSVRDICDEGDCPIEAEFYTSCKTCYVSDDKYYPMINEERFLFLHYLALLLHRYLLDKDVSLPSEYFTDVEKIKYRYLNQHTYTGASREFVLNHFIKYFDLMKDTFIEDAVKILFADEKGMECV